MITKEYVSFAILTNVVLLIPIKIHQAIEKHVTRAPKGIHCSCASCILSKMEQIHHNMNRQEPLNMYYLVANGNLHCKTKI